MPYRTLNWHLIWDFDGTLYDTYPRMVQELQTALATFGKTAIPERIYSLIKQTLYYGISVLASENGLDTDMLMAAFRREHERRLHFTPMPGLSECLAQTAALGCRHYLFTHRDHAAIEQLETDALLPLFTDTVTREQGFADKPAPDAILHLMRKHSFSLENAVMIGDRDIDILSGAAAGVRGILLDPEGFYPDMAVTWRVRSLSEIIGLLSA